MLLQGKNAVNYGAEGNIGSAVAGAFAGERARVFLAGRTLSTLEAVGKSIAEAGGLAEVAQVDALGQQSVEGHLNDMVQKAGGVDVSFNVIGLGEAQGEPLVEMNPTRFLSPLRTSMESHIITATAAVRHTSKQR